MPKKIAKTLFIGLGGTGNLALKYAKKRFYEIYASPEDKERGPDEFKIPMVEYLAIDTDIDDLRKPVGSEVEISLRPNEYLHASVMQPSQVLRAHPYIEEEWMPKENTKNIRAIENGAGQIRALGRLALLTNFQRIKDEITRKAGQIESWRTTQNIKYEAMGGDNAPINVVFCFSVAGGTGSGIFLDMSYIVRECLSTSGAMNSQAYIVLPEIFDKEIRQPIGKQRIWANSYGALRELEYFMENKFTGSLDLLRDNMMNIRVDGPPFDLVHLIADKSKTGTDYDEIEHIMELVANSVVLKSGELNTEMQSAWDNIRGDLTRIDYLDDQRMIMPRYLGLGYAEMRYNTDMVVNFASKKYATYLLDRLIDSNNRDRISQQRLEERVKAWGIKEHEADDLIDSILPASTQRFEVDGDGYAASNTRQQLESEGTIWLADQLNQVNEIADLKLEELKQEIIPIVINEIVGEGGVVNLGGIDTGIEMINRLLAEPFIALYKKEMSNEIENSFMQGRAGIASMIRDLNTQRIQLFADLEQALDSFFTFRRSRCRPVIEQIIASYNRNLSLEREAIRRERALRIYIALEDELNSLKLKLQGLKDKVRECRAATYNEVDAVVKRVQRSAQKPFVMELHEKRIQSFNSEESDEHSLTLFIDHAGMNIADLDRLSVDELSRVLFDFIEQSNDIQRIKESDNIQSFLTDMQNESGQNLRRTFQKLRSMSSPLMRVEEGRFTIQLGPNWSETVLWCKPSEDWPVFRVLTDVQAANEETMVSDDDSFVSVATLDYPYPMIALSNIQKYYEHYCDPRSRVSFDFDKRIRQRMDEERFQIVQENVNHDRTLFSWIFGCVIHVETDGEKGIHRRAAGDYFCWSGRRGRSLDGHFVSLGSPWRYLAYDQFQEGRYDEETIVEIRAYLDRIGNDRVRELIDEIKDMDTYITKYASLGRSLRDLQRDTGDPRSNEVIEMVNMEVELIQRINVDSLADYL